MSDDFNLTDDHLVLIRNAYWRWNDCEHGAPMIDPKRPFGNSDVVQDMLELLPHLHGDEVERVFSELPQAIKHMAANWPGPEKQADEVGVELAAMSDAVQAIAPLTQEAKFRVFRYLNDRFGGAR